MECAGPRRTDRGKLKSPVCVQRDRNRDLVCITMWKANWRRSAGRILKINVCAPKACQTVMEEAAWEEEIRAQAFDNATKDETIHVVSAHSEIRGDCFEAGWWRFCDAAAIVIIPSDEGGTGACVGIARGVCCDDFFYEIGRIYVVFISTGALVPALFSRASLAPPTPARIPFCCCQIHAGVFVKWNRCWLVTAALRHCLSSVRCSV
jgi:hypothetical protein